MQTHAYVYKNTHSWKLINISEPKIYPETETSDSLIPTTVKFDTNRVPLPAWQTTYQYIP